MRKLILSVCLALWLAVAYVVARPTDMLSVSFNSDKE